MTLDKCAYFQYYERNICEGNYLAKRKSTAHYVDNKVFLQAMKDWKEQCEEALQTGD